MGGRLEVLRHRTLLVVASIAVTKHSDEVRQFRLVDGHVAAIPWR
jgi:hypothetical protein